MDTINTNTNTTNICELCGCTDEELFELFIDGETRLVCADCAEANGYVRCADCGKWVLEDDSYTTVSGDVICEACYCEGYITCEDCGEVIPVDDATIVNRDTRYERYVCESCLDDYYRCDDCGGYFSDTFVHQDEWDTVVCDACYDRQWYTCDDCGRLIQNWEVYWADNTPYCENCIDDHRECGNFHDYGYKPEPEFQYRSSERHDVLTFGVELEVDKGNDHEELCDQLAELNQPIYMKHDGSLGDEGVEIVTHPCSLAFHQYELRWAEIARTCKANDYKSHDAVTCGLHVHVGLAALGADRYERNTTQAKIVLLCDRIKDQLTTFSRRGTVELNRWAAFPCVNVAPYMSEDELRSIALRTENDGRYQAVNLCPAQTIEFRLFRGTLKRGTLIATLQLVNNIVKYALSHSLTECAFEATWADVLATEQYKELATYAASRGLM